MQSPISSTQMQQPVEYGANYGPSYSRLNEQLNDKKTTVGEKKKAIQNAQKWLEDTNIGKTDAQKYAEKLVLHVGMDDVKDTTLLQEGDFDMCEIKPIHKRKLMKHLNLSSEKTPPPFERQRSHQGGSSLLAKKVNKLHDKAAMKSCIDQPTAKKKFPSERLLKKIKQKGFEWHCDR